MQRLLATARVIQFARGQHLFSQGDSADSLFLVLDGWVKVFRTTPEGDETVLHVIGPHESFAEPAALGIGHYPANAEGASDGRMLSISAELYRTILREEPELALNTIGRFAMKLRRMVGEREQILVRSTDHRLAAFLLNHAEQESVEEAVSLSLPYDKGLLAARLGMKPESLSRALSRLKELGVSSKGNQITIASVQALRDFIGD